MENNMINKYILKSNMIYKLVFTDCNIESNIINKYMLINNMIYK